MVVRYFIMSSHYDENSRTTIICASSADGVTIIPIQCMDTSHKMKVIDGAGGIDNGNNNGNAMLDENSRPVWTALSSAGDGSIIEVYSDASSGSVLVKST